MHCLLVTQAGCKVSDELFPDLHSPYVVVANVNSEEREMMVLKRKEEEWESANFFISLWE